MTTAVDMKFPRRILSLSSWPQTHQALWAAGTAPRAGRLSIRKHADTLRPMSIRNAKRGYGAFLGALSACGVAIDTPKPADLVTCELVARFVDGLYARYNKANTVKTRLFDLRVALRIMEPTVELDWLTRPGGVSINDLFPQEFEIKEMIDPRELTQIGLNLIERARMEPVLTDQAKRDCRNGALCVILASFPIRLGSMSLMRFGHNVFDHGTTIDLRFAPAMTKNKVSIETPLPNHTIDPCRYYLDVVRPTMIGATDGGWFWLNVDGSRLHYAGIQAMFRILMKREHGTGVGTHSARHALASALANVAPARSGLSTAILGVGEAVVSKHYQRANMRQASRFVNGLTEDDRAATRLRAETLFGHKHLDTPSIPEINDLFDKI
jgi:integrase